MGIYSKHRTYLDKARDFCREVQKLGKNIICHISL